jgi:hypothetical protein
MVLAEGWKSMSDPFIDELHDRLKSAVAGGAAAGEDDDQRAAALARWWEEFVDVLGQKVGAWNERQAPRPPVNFTKQPNGAVHVWHRSAEARFARDGGAIRVSTRLGAEPEQEAVLAMRTPVEENNVRLVDRDELRTPTAVAEEVLTPVLVATFEKP